MVVALPDLPDDISPAIAELPVLQVHRNHSRPCHDGKEGSHTPFFVHLIIVLYRHLHVLLEIPRS